MKLPTIIVNFKTYGSATGERALLLAKIHERVVMETGVSIAIAVQPTDIALLASEVKIPVFAQHIDAIEYGAHTGYILAEAARAAGAYGTLLNHAEHQIEDGVLRKSIEAAKRAGLYTVVCANTPERGAEIVKYGPDLVAVEPPDLIGGDVSVSTAEPEIIKNAVKLIGEGKVLVGAGVRTAEDIKIALALGAQGVLLASGVTKAMYPEKVLRELAAAINP
ncbi:MAG: triose-phosphate isomerase [Patescibacteria group bacterium]